MQNSASTWRKVFSLAACVIPKLNTELTPMKRLPWPSSGLKLLLKYMFLKTYLIYKWVCAFACICVCKQSRGIKDLWSEVSKYSFNIGQITMGETDCLWGWYGGDTNPWRTFRLMLGDAHTDSFSGKQQATADKYLQGYRFLLTPIKEKGKKCHVAYKVAATSESVCSPLLCSHPLLKALGDYCHLVECNNYPISISIN